MGEIVASQAAMLRRLGREGGKLSDRQLARTYVQQVQAVRLNAFLGGGLDVAAMAAAVVPELRRQKT